MIDLLGRASTTAEMDGSRASGHLAGTPAPISIEERRGWIRRFGGLIEGRTDEFVHLIVDEIGKPAHEALTSDVLTLLSACRWHERRLATLLAPQRLRGGPIWMPGQRHFQHRAPLGRVAIIATWNYPVQLLGVQLVQAIAGGNDVVVKPSERAPRTQRLLLETAREAGLSARRLSWVDPTREAGQALLLTERFDHIVFTGSTGVGRAVAELAAQTLTPTTLELAGRDSALVLADADLPRAAARIWQAVTMNAGQTCMAPRRVLVEAEAWGGFLAALAPLAAAARPVSLIDAQSAETCYALARHAVAAGGRSASAIMEPPRGRELRPLAIVDCPKDAELVEGRHFGPVVAIVRVRDMVEALQVHHRAGQHLAASVYTRSRRRAGELRDVLGVSFVTINDSVLPTVHPAASIGGRGESGWGVSRGHEGLLAMTRPVVVSTSGSRLRVSTEPPTAAAMRGLRTLSRWLYGTPTNRPPRADDERRTADDRRGGP
ncbi:MAG: aldehyde dehydrogenase family protein [Phycisphaerales bacterium]